MNDRMAYVQPSTNIVLIKNCILQKSVSSETDTLYFETEELQTKYFNDLGNKVEYSPTTYQNMGQGVMRIGKTMKELYGSNYMYFTNKNEVTIGNNTYTNAVFENKRYYCFIDGLKYINNNCTEVYYSIDYIQTFMFDYDEKTCLVERMTTDDDTIGNYLLDEGLDLGSELKVLKVDEAYFASWAYFVLFGCTDNLPNNIVQLDTDHGAKPSLKGVFTDFDVDSRTAKYFNEFIYSVPHELLNENMPIFVEICTGVKQYPVLDGTRVPPVIDTANTTTITFGVTPDSWKVFGKIFTGKGVCGSNSDTSSEAAVSDYEKVINSVYYATLCPTVFTTIGAGGTIEYSTTVDNFVSGKVPGTDTGTDCLQTIDGYTPKNKKLFTYPYIYLLACSSEGETQPYRFEWFNIHGEQNNYRYYQFELSACAVPMPICSMTPKEYYLSGGAYNKISGLVISNFQQIPLFTDSYKEYVAKNRYRENMAMTNAVLSGINTVVSPIAPTMLSDGFNKVKSLIHSETINPTYNAAMSAVKWSQGALGAAKDIYQAYYEKAKRNEIAKMTPPGLIGQVGTPDLKVYLDKFGYYLLTMGIDSSHAKLIDDYFTRYGYKLMQNIAPSRKNNGHRKNFTFIKTIECNLAINQHNSKFTGFTMSQADGIAIEEIYNNGIRFWYGTDGDGRRYYKDYSVPNEIVNGG